MAKLPIHATNFAAGPESVTGLTSNPNAPAVTGLNKATNATGSLAGTDTVLGQHAGVFGQSDQQGVFGFGQGNGTGVYGHGSVGVYGHGSVGVHGHGDVGIHGETTGTNDDAAGVRGVTYGTGAAVKGVVMDGGDGPAGQFEGAVEIDGNLHVTNSLSAASLKISGNG